MELSYCGKLEGWGGPGHGGRRLAPALESCRPEVQDLTAKLTALQVREAHAALCCHNVATDLTFCGAAVGGKELTAKQHEDLGCWKADAEADLSYCLNIGHHGLNVPLLRCPDSLDLTSLEIPLNFEKAAA